MNKNKIIVIPKDLLYHSYFDEYRQIPKNNEIIYNNLYYTNLNTDNESELGNQEKLKFTNKNKSKYNIMINTRKIKKFNKKSNSEISSETQKRFLNTETNPNIQKRFLNTEKKMNQHGGFEQLYKSDKNTPFKSNDEKTIAKKRYDENPKEQSVLLEQKVYQPQQAAAPKQQLPMSFLPIYGPGGEPIQDIAYNYMLNQPPIQKTYNISLANPIGNFTQINRIYEDILPGNLYSYTAITVYQRQQLINYIRNNLLQTEDGETASSKDGKKSLLSFIKVMSINPYYTKNPYTELPMNFLLYRAGYPIRYDNTLKNIGISKESMGLQLRMYRMSIGELNYKQYSELSDEDFDLWREIKYYYYIKNEVVKKKVSPNFICPILYKIDAESSLNWYELENLKKTKLPEYITNAIKNNQLKIYENCKYNGKVSYIPTLQGTIKHFVTVKQDDNNQFAIKKENDSYGTKSTNPRNPSDNKLDLSLDSKNNLLLLTEAPTSSFIQWFSPVYEGQGTVRKMISTGFHTEEVWKSILFQLIYIFIILHKYKISFENLSIRDNFYIKDVFSDSSNRNFWIYRIDEIDYYVPNYGYILLFDSKYKDITPDDSKEHQFKINSSIFKKNHSKKINFEEQVLQNAIDCINPDTFTNSNLKAENCNVPDDSIKNLLKGINDNLNKNKDINKIIPEFFKDYCNPKIGMFLTKVERDNINQLSRPTFIKGGLLIYEIKNNIFIWVVDMGPDESNVLKRKILVKENNNYNIKSVFQNSLFAYPMILEDNFNILETYKLN